MTAWWRTIGLACFATGLLFARSHSSRVVLDRWSWTFTAILAAAFFAAAASAVLAYRRPAPEAAPAGTNRFAAAARSSLDGAIFVWGVAYLLSAWQSPSTAGRIVELAPFGSIPPIPSLFEGVAIALAALAAALAVAPRLGARWQNAGLLVGAIAAFLVVAEGGARLKVAIAPAVDGFPTYSTKAWMRRYARVDADGFRNGPLPPEAPGGPRRLAVVGDSVAFGWGIRKVEDRFGEVLAGLLEKDRGEPWTVLTLARADTGTLDHLRFLETAIARRPDLLVLLYVFNDIDYLSAATPRTGWGPLHPAGIAFRNSYLFQEIYLRLRASGLLAGPRPPDPYFDAAVLARHMDDVKRWVDRGEASGATVVVVPFDAGVIAEEQLVRRYRTFFEAAEAAGLPLCSLEHAFDGRPYDAVTVNKFDRHPNELGHRLGAEAAARCLLARMPAGGTTRP